MKEHGQSIAELAVILALVFVLAAGTIAVVGHNVNRSLRRTAEIVGSMN